MEVSEALWDRLMVCAEAFGVLRGLRKDDELPPYVHEYVDRLIARHDEAKVRVEQKASA